MRYEISAQPGLSVSPSGAQTAFPARNVLPRELSSLLGGSYNNHAKRSIATYALHRGQPAWGVRHWFVSRILSAFPREAMAIQRRKRRSLFARERFTGW